MFPPRRQGPRNLSGGTLPSLALQNPRRKYAKRGSSFPSLLPDRAPFVPRNTDGIRSRLSRGTFVRELFFRSGCVELLQKGVHVGPEPVPRVAFGLGKFGKGGGVADAGEIPFSLKPLQGIGHLGS